MNKQDVLLGTQSTNKLIVGVNKLADAVKVTLGANGKNVIIDRGADLSPAITKDGVTVANSINLVDKVESMGATLLKEVANKTVELSGDGTTTSVVLAQSIILKGIESVANGANASDIKKGIDKATTAVIDYLKEVSKQIDETDDTMLRNIATISANNDSELGELIASAVKQVGKDGLVSIGNSNTHETNVTQIDGVKYHSGFTSPMFVTDQIKMECVLENPLILTYSGTITKSDEAIHLLQIAALEERPLLIIADEVSGDGLSIILFNRVQKGFPVCIVQSPGYSNIRNMYMEDISMLTDSKLISNEKGLKLSNVTIADFGYVDKAIINKNSLSLIGTTKDQAVIDIKKQQLRELIDTYQGKDDNSTYLKEIHTNRLAQLVNGIASINVGGITETEIKEKKDRIDDALCATRSALEEGYVPGGGSALLIISNASAMVGKNEDEDKGAKILFEAIKEPFYQMLSNANIDDSIEIQGEIIDKGIGFGYNLKTNKVENLFEAGVIDPTKVVRVALENAASIASIFLTTGCVIYDVE